MSTTVVFIGPPGQIGLDLLLCPLGTYARANVSGSIATETARAGVYTAVVNEGLALTGWHSAHIASPAGWELPVGNVLLVDGETCYVRDSVNDSPGLAAPAATIAKLETMLEAIP